MNMEKYIGYRAYFTKCGSHYGKPVTITEVVDEYNTLVKHNFYGKEWGESLLVVPNQFLTIELKTQKGRAKN